VARSARHAEEILDERVGDAFTEDETNKPHNKQTEDDSEEEWTVDGDVRMDGGRTVGFSISRTRHRRTIHGGSTQ
jgi:hypothetical protein